MRIGIDARLWNETGVGRYIRALFRYLPHDQEFVWFLNSPTFETLEMPKNWKKIKCNVRWHTFKEQLIMPFFFYKERLDLLHIPYVNFPLFYFGKTVATIHDLIPDHYRTGKVTTLPWWFFNIKNIAYHFLIWVATRRTLKIFTLSNDAKNEIVDHYKVNPEKIVVTHDSGKLEDTSKKIGSAHTKKPYILYVGNAHPHKNVESLIKAIEIINANRHSGSPATAGLIESAKKDAIATLQHDEELKLVLVGSDKFFYPRLPKSKYVEVIGEVPNNKIADWYRHAQALVTASKMEGFGIPPLEAMSVGCPAIVSDIPVFHEVYGDAAVYFNHLDPQNIAEVIKKTLANKRLLKEMVELGYKQAAKYSWKKCVQETHKIYESSLGLRSGK